MTKQLKLLLVDDEPQILESLSQLFDYEYTVLTATSGEEALSLLGSNPDIAIVISDQRMNGMPGVAFLRHVKKLAPESMRILLTGYSDLESVLQSVNVGEVFRYVRKPWQPDTLKSIVALAAVTYTLRNQQTKKPDSISEPAGSLACAFKLHTQSHQTTRPASTQQDKMPTPSSEATPTSKPPASTVGTQPANTTSTDTASADTPNQLGQDFLSDIEKKLDTLSVHLDLEEQHLPVAHTESIEALRAEFQSYLSDDILAEFKRYASFEEEFFARLNEANSLDLIASDNLPSFEKRFCGKSGNPRVLFVDDDSDVLYLLSETFKREYDVFTCLSAESAMELLEGNSFFACIVADMRMPGQSGSDFLIQAEAIEPLVPKILMSSYTDAEVIISLVNHGLLYRFVSKPYDVPNLKGIIASAVQECRRRVENGLKYRRLKQVFLNSKERSKPTLPDELYFPPHH